MFTRKRMRLYFYSVYLQIIRINMDDSKKLLYFAPGRTLFFAALALILIGTALLALPASHSRCYFLARSLFFRNISRMRYRHVYRTLRKLYIHGATDLLALLQIGGLSLITFTILVASRFIRFGLSGQLKAQQFAEIEIGKGENLLPFIFICTAVLETIGALIIFSVLRHDLLGQGHIPFNFSGNFLFLQHRGFPISL